MWWPAAGSVSGWVIALTALGTLCQLSPYLGVPMLESLLPDLGPRAALLSTSNLVSDFARLHTHGAF